MMNRLMRVALAVALGALPVTGCNFDIANPNSPDPIGNKPEGSSGTVAAPALCSHSTLSH